MLYGMIIVFAIISLAACGGGGGSASIAATTTPPAPGSIDTSFGDGGFVRTSYFDTNNDSEYNRIYAIAIQSDGKIVVAGEMGLNESGTTNVNFIVARYNQNGTLDTSFGTGGFVVADFGDSDYANAIAIQSDGKIVVGGMSDGDNDNDARFALARFKSDGTLDEEFDDDGMVTTKIKPDVEDQISALAIDDGGNIVAVGGSGYDCAIAVYKPNGQLKNDFGSNGIVTEDFSASSDHATSVKIQDGKIVVTLDYAESGTSKFALARFKSDGNLDTSFDGDGKVITTFDTGNATATCLALIGDKILAGGYVRNNAAPGSAYFALARYSSDGTLDATFENHGKLETFINYDPVNTEASSMAVQSDGKILLGGWTFIDSKCNYAVLRYNADGTLDSSFGTDGKKLVDIKTTSYRSFALALQSDSKIVAGYIVYDLDDTGADCFGLFRLWP